MTSIPFFLFKRLLCVDARVVGVLTLDFLVLAAFLHRTALNERYVHPPSPQVCVKAVHVVG
jgi:hypothetical protein